jgi:hypothetical protein
VTIYEGHEKKKEETENTIEIGSALGQRTFI